MFNRLFNYKPIDNTFDDKNDFEDVSVDIETILNSDSDSNRSLYDRIRSKTIKNISAKKKQDELNYNKYMTDLIAIFKEWINQNPKVSIDYAQEHYEFMITNKNVSTDLYEYFLSYNAYSNNNFEISNLRFFKQKDHIKIILIINRLYDDKNPYVTELLDFIKIKYESLYDDNIKNLLKNIEECANNMLFECKFDSTYSNSVFFDKICEVNRLTNEFYGFKITLDYYCNGKNIIVSWKN